MQLGCDWGQWSRADRKQRPGITVRDLQECAERHRRAATPHINCVRHPGIPEILGTALFQMEVSVLLLLLLLIKELGENSNSQANARVYNLESRKKDYLADEN